jgi:hypothetical protein
MILERSDHPLPAVGDSMKIDALKRREFITLFSGAVGWPLGAAAQQVKKIRRIGWLGMSTAADAALDLYAFRRGLRDLGHVDGQGSGEPDLMGGRSLGQSGTLKFRERRKPFYVAQTEKCRFFASISVKGDQSAVLWRKSHDPSHRRPKS